MYWQKRFDREDPDAVLLQQIEAIREIHKDYGYRRLWGELRKQGIEVNKKRVHRIVQKYGLQVTSYTRKSRRFSTYKGVVGRISPNRVNRRFNTCIPHQKITTDTSEFKYYESDENGRVTIKKLYLDPFLDLWNLEVLSYGVSDRPSANSIMTALSEAIDATKRDSKRAELFENLANNWNAALDDWLSGHTLPDPFTKGDIMMEPEHTEELFGQIMDLVVKAAPLYKVFAEVTDQILADKEPASVKKNTVVKPKVEDLNTDDFDLLMRSFLDSIKVQY